MKTLFLVRHAKSSWANIGQPDFERPLNHRGEHDAPMMARRLWDKGIRFDALVSSPAIRAMSTARFFGATFGFSKKDIRLIDRLYHADSSTFYDVIARELKDEFSCVALFSHNPGITYFVNTLGVAQIDNMPTCAVFGVQADIEHWKDFADADKRFLLFDYPKSIA